MVLEEQAYSVRADQVRPGQYYGHATPRQRVDAAADGEDA